MTSSRTWLFPYFYLWSWVVAPLLGWLSGWLPYFQAPYLNTSMPWGRRMSVLWLSIWSKEIFVFLKISPVSFCIYLIVKNWVTCPFWPITYKKHLTSGTHLGSEGYSQLRLRLHGGRLGVQRKLKFCWERRRDIWMLARHLTKIFTIHKFHYYCFYYSFFKSSAFALDCLFSVSFLFWESWVWSYSAFSVCAGLFDPCLF